MLCITNQCLCFDTCTSIYSISMGVKRVGTIKSMNRCFHISSHPLKRVRVTQLARLYVLISRDKASVVWSIHNILDFNHVEKWEHRARCDNISFALYVWRRGARIQRNTWKLWKGKTRDRDNIFVVKRIDLWSAVSFLYTVDTSRSKFLLNSILLQYILLNSKSLYSTRNLYVFATFTVNVCKTR